MIEQNLNELSEIPDLSEVMLKHIERARKGDELAIARIAERMWDGEGVPRSEVKALALYKHVATKGNVRIQRKLGKLYSQPGPYMDPEKSFH